MAGLGLVTVSERRSITGSSVTEAQSALESTDNHDMGEVSPQLSSASAGKDEAKGLTFEAELG